MDNLHESIKRLVSLMVLEARYCIWHKDFYEKECYALNHQALNLKHITPYQFEDIASYINQQFNQLNFSEIKESEDNE